MTEKKLHFVSLGCPKNLVDSEVMLGILSARSYSIIEDPAEADVIIVNTCAFIADAKQEAIDTILEMAEFKRAGSLKMLIVTGCLPQRYEADLSDLMPEVDLFVGAGEFNRIGELMDAWDGKQSMHVAKPIFLYDHLTPRIVATPKHTAFVKIAEGCFHNCSYCIIPQIRGQFRSRKPDSVIEEVKLLLSKGVLEFNLIAQDTTAYGRDVGSSLTELLDKISAIEGKKWVRIMYAYPHNFPEGVIDAMRYYPDLCSYLDIPIQHISNKILKSMGRAGDGSDIRKLIEKLRHDLPGVSLRTSLIVGYPGETKEDFEELLDYVCEAQFEHLGVFAYSDEEGTKAAEIEDGIVPTDVAARRRDELMDVQRDISYEINQKLVGSRVEVLVEGVSGESEYLIEARHEGQAPEIDGVVYINDGDPKLGAFATVEITEAHEYDLIGKVV